MDFFKKNKSLVFLLITVFVYILLYLSLINPLINKNNELENKKITILSNKESEKESLQSSQQYVNKVKRKDNIVLLIKDKIGSKVDIKYIQRKTEQENNGEEIIEVSVSSTLQKIFQLEDDFEKLEIKNSLSNMKIESYTSEKEKNKSKMFNCTMTFKVT